VILYAHHMCFVNIFYKWTSCWKMSRIIFDCIIWIVFIGNKKRTAQKRMMMNLNRCIIQSSIRKSIGKHNSMTYEYHQPRRWNNIHDKFCSTQLYIYVPLSKKNKKNWKFCGLHVWTNFFPIISQKNKINKANTSCYWESDNW